MKRNDRRSTTHERRAAPLLAGITLSVTLGLGAASADDTEIFFGAARGAPDAIPNLLFVLDTSNSMKAASDTAGVNRLEALQSALIELAENAEDVNIGVMRFNGKAGGSAVIWPLRTLDGTICVGDGCEELGAVASVAAEEDDAEESFAGGSVDTDGYGLALGSAVGLRFDRLDVPQGATILGAEIDLVAFADSSGPSTLTIAAEASDDAAPFTSAAGDISARARTVGVGWAPGAWTADARYSTPDIAAAVQQVIDRPGWCGGNALAVLVEGSGERRAQSWRSAADPGGAGGIDPATAAAARIRVSYSTESIPAGGGCRSTGIAVATGASADDAQEAVGSGSTVTPEVAGAVLELGDEGGSRRLVGLRFPAVTVPAGASIEEAWIELEVAEKRADGAEPLSLLIGGESDTDADPYDAATKGDISKRKRVGATVSWDALPAYEPDESARTPDLAAIVQEIVDGGGWASGNAMAFTVEHLSGTGTRIMKSHDGGAPGAAPVLRLRFRANGAAGAAGTMAAADRFREVIGEIGYASGTPIVDALYEAGLYLRGEAVDYGRQRGVSHSLLPENRVSHVDAWSGGVLVRPDGCSVDDFNGRDCVDERIVGDATYDSPITATCQSSHVVLLTDGQASSNSSAQKVRDLTGVASCAIDTGVRACGEELAEWLYATDHAPSVPELQQITTHTIGFDFSGEWLKSLARHGGGEYYGSVESSQLQAVFEEILTRIADDDTSFVTPAATISQFNRLTHRDDIYFAMFRPDTRPRWSGNLKRYVIGGGEGAVEIRDRDGAPAVDPLTGFFAENARSFWSATVDGPDVGVGGAAGQIDDARLPGGREVYTFTGDPGALGGTAAELTADEHALLEGNDELTLELLGLAKGSNEKEARAALIAWARGVDTLDADEDGDVSELRAHIGDPMHSTPVLLTYDEEGGERTSIYLATNEGYLHSIDSEDGIENYAFIPQELLGNLQLFRDNSVGAAHPYGLDGALSVRIEEEDGNVVVDAGEKAYLYAGMRRGGRNYYALDVSSRLAPKLAWVIEGGSGDFAELGQSWSRPVPARVMLEGKVRDVVIFGAGYDTAGDAFANETSAPRRAVDGVGRGFFIVDAKSGEKLWAALGPGAAGADEVYLDMQHSVPGDIRVIDVDFDGLADQLWFGDTGGQLWRFDFAPYHRAGDSRDFVDGGVMAELGGALVGEERRFYYEPDVALVSVGGRRALAISIGSGWRAHPLDETVEDRFYVLRSDAIYGAPPGYGRPLDPGSPTSLWRPITEADLVAVSGGAVPASGSWGWYLDLPRDGEKVLAKSITVNNQVIFTTYRPEASPDPCEPAVGGGSVYVLDVLDGSATVDIDGDGSPERSTDLVHAGIPPGPTALLTGGGPTVLVGPEQPVEVGFGNLTQRSYWIEHKDKRSSTAVVADGE